MRTGKKVYHIPSTAGDNKDLDDYRELTEGGITGMGNLYCGEYSGVNNYPARGWFVDMVFCVDVTGDMSELGYDGKAHIDRVKEGILQFYDRFIGYMEKRHEILSQYRIRVICFRDYIADGEEAMKATDFFLLPQQSREFEACINGIHADGGGDIPEDGLEALAYAIRSKWTTVGVKKRQVIVVWTNAGTHELGYGRSAPNYPKGMPKNLSELEDWWDSMDDYTRRLIICAPDTNYWKYISENWEKVYHVPSAAGDGMSEIDFQEVITLIPNDI